MSYYWHTFLIILRTPFLETEMIWGIVPLYFGWFCNELTPSKASYRTAVQTGFTFLWAGAQWLFQYAHQRPRSAPVISVDALLAVNMIVTLLVIAFGLMAFVSGIRRKFPKHFQFLGHTRFAAYFMVAMFPRSSGTAQTPVPVDSGPGRRPGHRTPDPPSVRERRASR
jgi:hypothetical protein